MNSIPPPVFAGIDVSKARLDVALSSGEGWGEYNDEPGIRALAKRLREVAPELVVLEATGGFETAVAAAAEPGGSAGGHRQSASGARLRPGHGSACQDGPDRCAYARALRRAGAACA